MAYLPQNNDNIIKDVNKRKEFYAFSPSDEYKETILDEIIKRERHLRFMPPQQFIGNFINPNTPYSRILIKWSTGRGKTSASLNSAMKFIEYYKNSDNDIGNIYIIGFSERVFVEELLSYPEYGYITREELKDLNKLKKLSANSVASAKKLQEFNIKIKKRLKDRTRNGFFKFIGYKALVNRLFLTKDTDININNLKEEEILKLVNEKKILVNKELLESFKNSLIICDEIHNVYNSFDKNNWGLALQYILDNIPSVRAIFLSATPLNNSPTEIIDLTNLISGRKLSKLDYFTKEGHLKKDAISKLSELWKGKVSFLRDANPKFFPAKNLLGETIKEIDYLKFIRCPMSELQYNTYKSFYNGVLSQENQYILDFVLPNTESKKIGVYSTNDIKKIASAPQKWKDSNNIDFRDGKIVGEIANIKNIKNYSGKYFKIITDIINLIKSQSGKIFIYHNVVHMSGVLFIEELLKRNGIIGDGINSNDNTLCVKCGNVKKNHKDEHAFIAAKYLIVHSDMDKYKISKAIEKYNYPSNIEGEEFLIFIGSKMIQESYNFLGVREMIIARRTVDIPSLIQLLGRGIRNYSHSLLPPDKRNINIRIYSTCLPTKKNGIYELSHEEKKYKKKIEDYKIIQIIERDVLHKNAVDAFINKKAIHAEKKNKSELDKLDILPYELSNDFPKKRYSIDDLNLSTFYAFHAQQELDLLLVVIKRLFIEKSPIWNYKDLWEAVKNPDFDAKMNSELFSQDLFNIALSKLVYNTDDNFIEPVIKNTNKSMISYLLDSNEKIIVHKNDQRFIIHQLGEYYILFNADEFNRPLIDIESPFRVKKIVDKVNINLNSFLKNISSIYNFDDKKEKFYYKWSGISIENLESAVCDFGTDFHVQFIEECIKYIFEVWTKSNIKKSMYHDFYFKMIHYYSLRELIIWSHTAKDMVSKNYEKFVSPVSEKILETQRTKIQDIRSSDKRISTSGIINMLKSSINNSILNWCPSEARDHYKNQLNLSLELFSGNIKIKNKRKVPSNLLPIGHFLAETPRFYHPNTDWYDLPEYVQSRDDYKENNIIIGYDDKSKTGIHIRFKLRPPIQNIKIHKDIRKIERGSVCTSSKSKGYLIGIAKKLGLDVKEKINIETLCSEIRTKLIHNELKERIKKTKIKWFYFSYEIQPKI